MKVILKYMGKLQKLKSLIKINKLFHYKFIVPKELFYTLKIKAYFISTNEKYIICYGNKRLYHILKEYDIEYVDQYKIVFKDVILKKIIIFITFILICIVFLSSSYFIREIKFKDISMYDYRVYSYVINKLDKKLFLYTLKDDINSISLSLRAAFPNYSYIGISKSGSSLIIDIEKINLKQNNQVIKNKNPIVSNYNAVICGIKCEEGVVLVNLNQSVNKGDLLVTPNSELGYCEAVILGKFSEYKTIVIKKEKIVFDYTGRWERKYSMRLGNKYLTKFKDIYANQVMEINKVFSFFNYLELDKVYYYEKDFIKVLFDYESAYNYAVSSIYAALELNRKSKLEKINDIILLKWEENSDEFVFYLLINQVKSIGIYSYS